VNSAFSNPDRHVGIAPDVLDPSGRFTRLGEEVETFAADYEPNLDLARQTSPPPHGRQIKDLLIRDTLESHGGHEKRAGSGSSTGQGARERAPCTVILEAAPSISRRSSLVSSTFTALRSSSRAPRFVLLRIGPIQRFGASSYASATCAGVDFLRAAIRATLPSGASASARGWWPPSSRYHLYYQAVGNRPLGWRYPSKRYGTDGPEEIRSGSPSLMQSAGVDPEWAARTAATLNLSQFF